ncbi:MAG: DUF3754 domain-containing protein [Proteobacteria bacterium]|nr:DUF3754 domain-containing protein [Pseudomonadota bacterium]
MLEGTPKADGYIAVRRAELAEGIAAADGLPQGEVGAFSDLLKLLDALLQYEAHERLEALKTLYDPLDPDAPPMRRNVTPEALDAFEAAFVDALTRANFAEIDHDTVQTREATKLLTGLSIKPSRAGIRRIRFFARGVRPEKVVLRTWGGLGAREVEAEMMTDVVVFVGFKAETEVQRADKQAFARMRRGVRPGAALIKHFRNVATAELVTLHPGARPSMRPRDQVFLAAPAIVAGAPVLLNLWPALTVIFAVLAAYFGARGAIEESQLRRALAAASGLIAVGAFVMRQRLKYETQTLRYQKQLADTVYFRNLANNTGVIDLVVGAGEEQDVKEALIAYWALRRAGGTLTKDEIDAAAEDFLRARFGIEIDFEVTDALAKLERLELIARNGENITAIPPAEALAKLDSRWDGLFKFSP